MTNTTYRVSAPLQTRLAELEQWLDTSEPFAAVHLRVGDNKLKDEGFAKQDPTGQSRAYSNKPLPTGKLMGQLLRSRLNQEHLPEIKSIFLATDSSQALEVTV